MAASVEKNKVQEIHPICPIEEYASIFRVLIWFRPPQAPMITDSVEQRIISSDRTKEVRLATRYSGAIFCQQAIMMPFLKVRPLSTSGNQKWHGASPSFIINASVIMECINGSSVEEISQLPVLHRLRVAALSRRAALRGLF